MKKTIRVENRDGYWYDVNTYEGKKIACVYGENDALNDCSHNARCYTCPFCENDGMEYTQEEIVNIIKNSNKYNAI